MTDHRPPYRAAAAAGGVLFLLYLITLAPTTAFWDTSEYIATGYILGIPHPPGNPLFVVLARVWILLLAPLGIPVAVRVNLLAALTSAGAGFFFYLLAHRVLTAFVEGRQALVGAGVAAFLGGTAFTVWNQSNVNEKVYTLSVLVIAAVSWLAVRWADRRHERGSERYLLVALFLMVLGSTNHLMSVLPAPALVLFVLLSDWKYPFRPTFLMRAVPLVLVGISFNLFLPIRAAQEPVINEGHPTCETWTGAATAVFSNGKWGCQALADNLSRKQYQKPDFMDVRMAPLGHQLLNYYQYFDWQWSRGLDPSDQPGGTRTPVSLLFLALGLTGLWAAFRSDRNVAAYLGALTLTLTFGLVYYLNFKYGYSLAPEVTGPGTHEVRERDYFFIASFMLWGVLAGIGLAWAWAVVTSLVAHPKRALFASPILLAALMPLMLNWSWATRAGDYAARDWAFNLLQSVEPYGVLFTNGDNDTFPLWYLQEVEGIRQDVTVIVAEYLNTSWYARQLQRLTSPEHQRPFDPSAAPGLYEGAVALPSASIVSFSGEEMDRIGWVELDEDVTVPLPGLAVTYPQGTQLSRIHQLTLAVIHDAGVERPIYFASSGGLMGQMGLSPWAVQQGLAAKLVLRPREQEMPEGWVQAAAAYGGGVFDVERSTKLWNEVFQWRGIRDREIWQDRSTLNIPYYFYALAMQLSDVTRTAGYPENVVGALEDDAQEFQLLADGGPRGTPNAVEGS